MLILGALREHGVDVVGWGLAWARLLPSLILIPALGTRVLPPAARAVLGLTLAFALTPTLVQPRALEGAQLVFAFALELLRGLPVALSSAALLWALMMAGGLMDDLRGAQAQPSPIFADAPTPLGTLLGLYVSLAFLQLGGGAHLIGALAEPPGGAGAPAAVLLGVTRVVAALGVAVALAAPVLCAVIVWEVASALIARAANPSHLQSVLAPVRSLVVLLVLAFSLDGMTVLVSRLLAPSQ